MHALYLSQGKRTVGMLYQAVRHKRPCPIGFSVVVIDGCIVIVAACRAPSPQIAVGAIRSGLTGIESAAVQIALMVIRPNGYIVRRTSRQAFERAGFEILHAAYLSMQLAIDEIPPVAHLKDIRALVETIPEGVHKYASVRPLHEIGGGEMRQYVTPVLAGCYQHMILAVLAEEHLRVTEIIAVVIPRCAIEPEIGFRPGDAIGRSSG